MERRTFFKWTLLSSVVQLIVPRWIWAQAAPGAADDASTLRVLAGIVLPASLGTAGLDTATARFTEWVRDYEAGAEMSAGYGMTRMQVVPADPSSGYAQHLRDLERAARARGRSFADLDAAAQRAIVTLAIDAAGVDALPRRPNGRHVAVDLMSHFFFISNDGQDWLHDAAIRRDVCRGLGSSGDRPARLR